jgi:hypothetical protein
LARGTHAIAPTFLVGPAPAASWGRRGRDEERSERTLLVGSGNRSEEEKAREKMVRALVQSCAVASPERTSVRTPPAGRRPNLLLCRGG